MKLEAFWDTSVLQSECYGMKGDEIQSDSLKDIAQTSVVYAFKRTRLPIFVEDAGLFIRCVEMVFQVHTQPTFTRQSITMAFSNSWKTYQTEKQNSNLS